MRFNTKPPIETGSQLQPRFLFRLIVSFLGAAVLFIPMLLGQTGVNASTQSTHQPYPLDASVHFRLSDKKTNFHA
ncbi:MAG TPA: hypothetical protein PKZ53_09075, partial [Acidobacteriota bacterium]|nr:hypothetical protein [Acidobacteriota bacterium]